MGTHALMHNAAIVADDVYIVRRMRQESFSIRACWGFLAATADGGSTAATAAAAAAAAALLLLAAGAGDAVVAARGGGDDAAEVMSSPVPHPPSWL